MPEGTTDKGAVGSSGSSGSSGNVTSGTASAAMIAAATAASSADTKTGGDTAAGDTSSAAGAAGSGATSGATGQPSGDAVAAAAAAKSQGEAPDNRIQAAVKNAREAAIQEFAWAKGLNPQDVKVALALLTGLKNDSRGFYDELGRRIGATKAEEAETLPEADLVSEDGKLRTYSEGTFKKALTIHEKNILRTLQTELKPLLDFMRGEQNTRAASEEMSRNREYGQKLLTHARENFPHFKDHETAIKEKLGTEQFQAIKREFGAIAALNMAYAQVLKEKVFPGIETAAEQRVREGFQKKANASSGSAHPADQGGEGKKPELNTVDQLARHMERLAGQQTAV